EGGGYGRGADDMGGGAPRAAARPAAARPAPQRAPAPAPKASTGFDDMDDDIPF
ncbi:MAG: single-stranded DNA-binding protein, partial [Roseateles sp.]